MPDLMSLDWMWPPVLWALLVLPALVVLRVRLGRQSPPPNGSAVSRHGAELLIVLGMAVLITAVARPQAIMLTPMREATVMLAIDTSGSMRASDLQPSRIDAARAAAERFLDTKPAHLRVGLVTVAGTAALAQTPTESRDEMLRALEQLPLQYGSALGAGLLIALDNLMPGAGIEVQKILNEASDGSPARKSQGQSLPFKNADPKPSGDVPDGRSRAIVLLTDGQGNVGPDLMEMARLASQHRVRVYTVGVGTPEGAIVQMQGRSMRVRLEEETLKQVARETQGEYFRATSVEGLHKVYDQLGNRFRFEKRAQSEITGAVAMLGMLLVLAGCLWSLNVRGRIL